MKETNFGKEEQERSLLKVQRRQFIIQELVEFEERNATFDLGLSRWRMLRGLCLKSRRVIQKPILPPLQEK